MGETVNMISQIEIAKGKRFLRKIIEENTDEKEEIWVNHQEVKLRENFQLRSFYIAFSSGSRFIRKQPLILSEEQLAEAERIREGFQPQHWNLLQCVRTYLLLILPAENSENYEANITRLHETADIEEQVTLYSALPLLPYPEEMAKRAAEGIRTNITDVFDAIALNNPYPADFLDQQAWNQMVLKAVFMQRPLYRIYRADDRVNPELARMLVDFAHERWAAHRSVWPELWRFVGPFKCKDYLVDIEKAIGGDPLEKSAGLLACASSERSEAQELLEQFPEIKKEIKSGRLTWTFIGKQLEDSL